MAQAAHIAKRSAETFRIGPTGDEATQMGPVVNRRQFDRVQSLIQRGIDEGARLITGGVGRPEGIAQGYFVKPTVFADVSPEMTIATEEIFGPVLSMIPYRTEAEAIEIANGTRFGLAAYVQSQDLDRARRIGRALQAGSVYLNYPAADFGAPFGGYKQSGNGREWGEFGLREYLELKAMIGYAPPGGR
jgi:aldehyde dehydrogenase (NAD+)